MASGARYNSGVRQRVGPQTGAFWTSLETACSHAPLREASLLLSEMKSVAAAAAEARTLTPRSAVDAGESDDSKDESGAVWASGGVLGTAACMTAGIIAGEVAGDCVVRQRNDQFGVGQLASLVMIPA